jgi:protein arginine kinase activator
MCRSCAVTRGYASEGEGLGARLDSLLNGESGPAAGVCGSCGWTAAMMRSSGRLGCPECVKAFRREIMSVLKRSGSQGPYEGKVPCRNSGAPDEPSLATLSTALELAIRSEDFEEAAAIRDRIRAGSGGYAP